MSETQSPPRWSDLSTETLRRVARILEHRHPAPTVESSMTSESDMRELIFRAGQHSVLKNVREAIKIKESEHG